MRVKLIATLAVLGLALAVCVASMLFVFTLVDQMEVMAAVVLERMDVNDTVGAREALSQLAEKWARAGGWLKSLTPHEDLHEVSIHATEAATTLEAGDTDDFRRSMALLMESLKHLREHESFSLSNVL
ncbi:DUF4363 family protein [Bacillota bacterium Meth-B3]|nr:DUF4363 family protein [Christensenellaceae bacterium]MEA5066159.1 DUF4363 family protein [Eubacteriales bacterium]MEA5069763.1 DUF4363 family protein [Christensenellaceae bacterium]